MYKFKLTDKSVINEFNSINSKGHIFQTAMWCDFKKDWKQFYIEGKDKDGKIVLTCSLIARKIPYINKYIGYVPRGFVCDYNNIILLKNFANYLKDFSKENKISFITIDPDIHLNENQNIVENGVKVKENLSQAGFLFAESDSKNFEAIQPKFSFRLDISKREGETVEDTKKRVFSNFHNKWRYNIKLGAQRCLEVQWFDKENITEEMLDEFQRIMEITGERDNFLVRKKTYFKELIEKVSPYARLYMVKYNIKEDIENSKVKLEKLEKERDKLENKISKFIERLNTETEEKIGENQLKSHLKDTKKSDDLAGQIDRLKDRIYKLVEFDEEYIYLSGAIYLCYGDKAWYLYGASSNDFRETMPNFSMQWAMIQDSIVAGYDVYDFRGVSGDLDESNPLYGLYKFKKGFNGDFVEFIGEADLVIDELIYKLFKEMFPKFKKVRAKLRKK